MVDYRLVRPIIDNRAAFKEFYPLARYAGDIGDTRHMLGTGDHTPYSSDVIFGLPMKEGFVYAQDFGEGEGLDLAAFTRWLLDSVRAGEYPEVKYVISRLPANLNRDGGKYYGLFDRRYSWRTQRSSGHTSHMHVSYMPGWENSTSRIVANFHKGVRPGAGPDPTWKRWAQAPPLPAMALGQYSTRTFDQYPYLTYPPIVLGYGGPESPPQADMVRAIHHYAVARCKTIMIPAQEITRAEFGPGSLEWIHFVTTGLAQNPWGNDPLRNGRAFGASIGAPSHW